MYRVLALSGGGVRGVFTSRLLERLSLPTDQLFAISGASTGSIIACGLAYGLSARDITEFYLDLAPKVFSRPFYSFKSFDRIFGAPYDLKRLTDACQGIFGDTRLGDLKKKVLISSYDLDAVHKGIRQAKAKFFHNFDAARHDKDVPVWEAIASSVAAIAFFKPYKNRYTDGGIVENHSGLALVSQLLHPQGGVGATPSQVKQLSLGTGAVPKYMNSRESRSWGILDSLKTAIDSIAQSNVSVADHVLSSLLGSDYFRLDQPLREEVDLDDYEKIPEVLVEADELEISECRGWLQGAGFYPVRKVS